ncbi:MAG: ATP-binding cassette domain-containing protein, partial [Actinomycetota bacterium]|nr:ATP-binding cassette domain-containing protein [Actinomycetota bacterium]
MPPPSPTDRTDISAIEPSAPVVEVCSLAVAYRERTGVHLALEDVDLTLLPGERVGILGESGSGKSTLAAALLGRLPDHARVTAGSVRIRGVDVFSAPSARRTIPGRVVGLVPQEPARALHPMKRIGRMVAEVVRSHRPGELAPGSAVVGALLELVELGPDPRFAAAFPHQLSGGERQRAVLARALAGNPAVLVADECLAASDARRRLRLMRTLRTAAAASGAALLVISHDPADLRHLVDQVLVLHRGRVV